ncbi:MAG: intradiol ring-cleavage dioxygenase [Lewinellaceae bacterium]|nr:intradiol ring-cleavage dioxygenase [Saprospiraceae bacterium]MCB9340718.1 intradiol ring-cleavage dioxygenase [Lewinellaceae bacterium]
MKQLASLFFFYTILAQAACQNQGQSNIHLDEPSRNPVEERNVGGPCECCDAWKDGLPETLSWQTRIAPAGEPGEPLEISGTVFLKDGATPAKDIILYVYHTDAAGLYSNGPTISTCARRHGHLRGWMKTGADGRYKFRTIRPASYPNTTAEQHIHPVIKEPGLKEYWIDEFLFDNDPNLTEKVRKHQSGRGGNGILNLTKNQNGIWTGQRDIFLGRNVSDY